MCTNEVETKERGWDILRTEKVRQKEMKQETNETKWEQGTRWEKRREEKRREEKRREEKRREEKRREEKRREEKRRDHLRRDHLRREVELSPYTPVTTVTHSPFPSSLIPSSDSREGRYRTEVRRGRKLRKCPMERVRCKLMRDLRGEKTVKETWEKVRKWAMEEWLDEYPNNERLWTERRTTERADEADVHGRAHKRHNYGVKVNCALRHSYTGEDRSIWSIYHSHVCASQ